MIFEWRNRQRASFGSWRLQVRVLPRRLKTVTVMLTRFGRPVCKTGPSGFDSRRRLYLLPSPPGGRGVGGEGKCVGSASVSQTACKAAAERLCRFESCSTHWARCLALHDQVVESVYTQVSEAWPATA